MYRIINELRNTASTNEKKTILERHKDNEIFKKILLYTYDPFRKYGISEKILNETMEEVTNESLPQYNNIFEFLDVLASSNINNELKRNIAACVKYQQEEYKDIVKCMFLKDLKIGANTTLINKVWKGLIPKFEVQLARKFNDVKLNDNEKIYITEKFDGIRCVIIKENENVKMFTRQGKEITGLNEIIENVKETFVDKSIVIDGELLALNSNNLDSGDLYRATVKIVNSKSENKTGIHFHAFDMLEISEFKNGESKSPYSIRRNSMENYNWNGCLELVPILYVGVDHEMIFKLLSKVERDGKEGIMVNREMVYQCKRNSGILKVKTMHTVDLRVLGYEEGSGRLENSLGALIVDYKGHKVNVGSGYSDQERHDFWNNRNDMIGKIVEIQYFEESTNEQGELSLRFPVFKHIRNDKTEPSYN